MIIKTDVDNLFRIDSGFLPDTRYAVSWVQDESGNWSSVDRGASADVYEAQVLFTGTEAQINNLIDVYEWGRAGPGGNYDFIMEGWGDNEHIFGADVDHSSYSPVSFVSLSDRVQKSWKGYSIAATLRAVSPSFVGVAAFPTLRYCEIGAAADSSPSMRVTDTYSGALVYTDHDNDAGIFTGTFRLSPLEMRGLRRYIATQRGGNFTLADTFGIDLPFGPRSGGSYPYTCKLIDWSDGGNWGVSFRKVTLSFAEVI